VHSVNFLSMETLDSEHCHGTLLIVVDVVCCRIGVYHDDFVSVDVACFIIITIIGLHTVAYSGQEGR